MDVDSDSGWPRRQREREEVAHGALRAAERASERVPRRHWTSAQSDRSVTPIARERRLEPVKPRGPPFLLVHSCRRRRPLWLASMRATAAKRGHGLSLVRDAAQLASIAPLPSQKSQRFRTCARGQIRLKLKPTADTVLADGALGCRDDWRRC